MSSDAAAVSFATMAVQNPLFRDQAKKAAFNAVDQEENDNELWNKNAKIVDPSQLDVDEHELEQIKKFSRYLKFVMIGTCILMIVTAWYNISGSASLSNGFIAIYVFFFAIMMCCFELAIRRVAVIIVQNFGFLYNPVGKVLFLLMVAVLCFQLSSLGKASFALILAYGCLTVYVYCKHPKFGQYQRLMHFYNKARAAKQISQNVESV